MAELSFRWDQFFQNHALLAAEMSRDTTQVGAALVDLETKTVVATGFNGPPRGVRDLPERLERPAKYLFAAHAEENLVAVCARLGAPMAGRVVYVTHAPCAACARMLIQAGVSEIRFGPGLTSMPKEQFDAAAAMMAESGVRATPWRCE